MERILPGQVSLRPRSRVGPRVSSPACSREDAAKAGHGQSPAGPHRARVASVGARKTGPVLAQSALGQGDPHAASRLLPLVYDELRKLAHSCESNAKSARWRRRVMPNSRQGYDDIWPSAGLRQKSRQPEATGNRRRRPSHESKEHAGLHVPAREYHTSETKAMKNHTSRSAGRGEACTRDVCGFGA
jgi:hypothetical protein